MPSPDGPLILTLDVGTSSVRALIWDRIGARVPEWQAEIKHDMTLAPDGGVETDAETLFKRTAKCIDLVLDQAGIAAGSIAAVGISTFWHSLLGIDGEGEALTPVYTWADTRSRTAAQELQQRLDEQATLQRTGCPIHASYLPAKLLWLSQDRPEVFAAVRFWMSFGEYLFLRFFNTRACSLSMASGTGLFDQRQCTWDEEVISVLPITAGQLSELVDAKDGFIGLRKKWADRWPALKNVAWYPALGDGACANVGSNCVTPERISLTIGTSGALRILLRANDTHVPFGLWRYRLDRERIVVGGALSNGGNVIRWLRANLNTAKKSKLFRAVGEMPPDGHGLTVLPFLAGERSPGYHADARGVFAGLNLGTTATDMVRASIEAVSYECRRIYDLLLPLAPAASELVGSGGALLDRSEWMQIMADVHECRVVACSEHEATSRGAALMALESLGELESIETAPDCLGATFEPRAEHFPAYRAALARHQQLYDRMLAPAAGPFPSARRRPSDGSGRVVPSKPANPRAAAARTTSLRRKRGLDGRFLSAAG